MLMIEFYKILFFTSCNFAPNWCKITRKPYYLFKKPITDEKTSLFVLFFRDYTSISLFYRIFAVDSVLL